MLNRRTLLAASAATLARPALARVQPRRRFKFVPASDLAVIDPIWTTAYATRNHGYLVCDTLYGQTGAESGFNAEPQMAAGHVVEDDGRRWKVNRAGFVGGWFS